MLCFFANHAALCFNFTKLFKFCKCKHSNHHCSIANPLTSISMFMVWSRVNKTHPSRFSSSPADQKDPTDSCAHILVNRRTIDEGDQERKEPMKLPIPCVRRSISYHETKTTNGFLSFVSSLCACAI